MKRKPSQLVLERELERLYRRLNKKRFVSPDPLQFLYDYDSAEDIEIVGIIASGLAYGRVVQILRSISKVLQRMGASPRDFCVSNSDKRIASTFRDFKHRFTTGEEMAQMLIGIKRAIENHGSLESCFHEHLEDAHSTVLPALTGFVDELLSASKSAKSSLLSSPRKGSACKRLHLYLRWMVRKDAVDPGAWEKIDKAKLIIPLDTHMYQLSQAMGLTERKQPNGLTAMDVTESFRRIRPDDPVRYDFALTRLGIRSDMTPDAFLDRVWEK